MTSLVQNFFKKMPVCVAGVMHSYNFFSDAALI